MRYNFYINAFSVKLLIYFLFSATSLLYIFNNIDPQNTKAILFPITFFLIFIAFFSLGSWIFYLLRKSPASDLAQKSSLREGFFLGLIVLFCAFLSSKGLLWLWEIIFLIVAFGLMEILILYKKGKSI